MTETGFVGAVEENLSEPVGSFPRRVRPVWLASYPRSGNTFLRIILQNFFRLPTYSIYNVQGQGFSDPSSAALEEAPVLPRDWRDSLSDEPGAKPMLLKTHDRPEGDGPAIYLVRDGRAAIDSYYHYHQKFAFEKPSLTEVIAGACQFGRWCEHYLAWQPRSRPNTLFLRYEDLVSQPQKIIPQVAEFLHMEPKDGRVPGFQELQQQFPVFFRRGQNADFLRAWNPGQMSLFNQLHGEIMKKLDYPLAQCGQVSGDTASELAVSAAHWHDIYLEKLNELGTTAATCQELYKRTDHLENELRRMTEVMQKKDAVLGPLLKSLWVKIGLTLGFLRRANKARRRLLRRSVQPNGSTAQQQTVVR